MSRTDEHSIGPFMTPDPHAIDPLDPLAQALRLMHQHGVRHLPVIRDGTLVGVLSKRDVSLMAPFTEAPPPEVTVEDVMTQAPYVVSPSTPLLEVASVMAERKIGSAVVVDAGKVVGLFTTVDALRALVRVLQGKCGAASSPRRARRGARRPRSMPRQRERTTLAGATSASSPSSVRWRRRRRSLGG